MTALRHARSALAPLLDPSSPAVLSAMTRLDALRHPLLPVRARIAPLAPRRRHRVAVVIPLYNYERYVAASIESAASQEGVDVHVVVVDDRSTDASYEVALEAARGRDNVTVLQNETNRGHGDTFNRGWQAVESDFVQRLDADDLLTPGAMARAVALAEAVPSTGMVYGFFREFPGDDVPAPQVGEPFGVVWRGHDWLRHSMSQDRCLVGTPAAVLRTSLMREHGGWRAELKHTQDYEMWLRAAAVSDIGRVFDADQALRRTHPASMSTVEQVGTVNFTSHLEGYDAWYEGVGRTLPDGAELRDIARAALARRAMRVARHAYLRGRPDDYAASQLVELARSVDPAAPHQREVALLASLHERLGPAQARTPWGVAGAAAYRVEQTLSLGRYRRTGH